MNYKIAIKGRVEGHHFRQTKIYKNEQTAYRMIGRIYGTMQEVFPSWDYGETLSGGKITDCYVINLDTDEIVEVSVKPTKMPKFIEKLLRY